MLETDNDHAVVDPDVSQVRNMRTRTGNAKTAAQAGAQALRGRPAHLDCISPYLLIITVLYRHAHLSMTCKIPAILRAASGSTSPPDAPDA